MATTQGQTGHRTAKDKKTEQMRQLNLQRGGVLMIPVMMMKKMMIMTMYLGQRPQ